MKRRWTIGLAMSLLAMCAWGCKKSNDGEGDDSDGATDTPLPLVDGEWGANDPPAGGWGGGGGGAAPPSGGGGGGGGVPSPGGGGGGAGATTTQPVVPAGSSPPQGVTWHIGLTENVAASAMSAFFDKIVESNATFWNISEGQVRIGHVNFWDNVAPGTNSNQMTSIDTSNLDMVVWPASNWNGPGLGYVIYSSGVGRVGRCIGVPDNTGVLTIVHEGSHFLWQLSWSAGPGLTDEYNSSPADNACVMELTWSPLRWCWSDNHLSQASQPTSCWEQILSDYPTFSYGATNTASAAPPAPTVTYNDTP